MTTVTKRRDLSTEAELSVERSGIRFRNIAPDHVRIAIDVRNGGECRSAPTPLRLESAPFGAFVRWQPLATLLVPSIEPGCATTVTTLARQTRPGPIAGFSGLIPRDLLTASAAGDAPRPAGTAARRSREMRGDALSALAGTSSLLDFLQRVLRMTSVCELPPSLQDLLVGSQPHWAGNLNVWIGGRPVERHVAPRLCVHPGRANVAVFLIGDRPDEYAFRARGEGASWRHELYDPHQRRTLLVAREDERPCWHVLPSLRALFLALRPPATCARGCFELAVTQRSSGQTASVELDLDPAADGPGCFTI